MPQSRNLPAVWNVQIIARPFGEFLTHAHVRVLGARLCIMYYAHTQCGLTFCAKNMNKKTNDIKRDMHEFKNKTHFNMYIIFYKILFR